MSLLDTASLIVTPNGYKEGKLYSVIPSDGSGDLSVTRATTATRVNSAGLVELVPYNLFTYSEQFNNADWQKRNNIAITANATTAPNGTLTADKMYLSNNLLADYGIFQILPSGQKTLSVYAKKAEIGYLYLGYNNDTAADGVFYNLNNGTISSNTSSYTASITDEGNGWYRCSVTLPTLAYAFISPSTNGTSFIVTGQLNNGLYIWGAQLNEGALKPYQKTETRLNIPRLDYSNGTCPSILVEPQRTNLLTYSSSFDNAAWTTQTISVTSNSTTAPDGTLTADTLTPSGSILFDNRVYQPQSVTNGVVYTLSVWAKSSVSNAKLTLALRNYGGQVFDITDQWERYSVQVTAGLLGGNFNIYAGDVTPITGAVNSSNVVTIWGAQLEAGSYATSYIPTTSASVTRNADVISKTGISSLIGQTEGTLYADFFIDNILNGGNFNAFLIRSDYNNLVQVVYYADGTIQFLVITAGVLQVNISASSYLTAGHHKFAVTYKNNDFAFYVDGNLIGTDTSGSVPNTSILDLTEMSGAKQRYNSFALWKTRLTNTQLAQLTTI